MFFKSFCYNNGARLYNQIPDWIRGPNFTIHFAKKLFSSTLIFSVWLYKHGDDPRLIPQQHLVYRLTAIFSPVEKTVQCYVAHTHWQYKFSFKRNICFLSCLIVQIFRLKHIYELSANIDCQWYACYVTSEMNHKLLLIRRQVEIKTNRNIRFYLLLDITHWIKILRPTIVCHSLITPVTPTSDIKNQAWYRKDVKPLIYNFKSSLDKTCNIFLSISFNNIVKLESGVTILKNIGFTTL